MTRGRTVPNLLSHCVALLATLLLSTACTPIPRQADDQRVASELDAAPLAKGDVVEPFTLTDSDGRTVTRESLADRTSVMLFGAPAANKGTTFDPLLERVTEVHGRLRPERKAKFHVFVLLLEHRPAAIRTARAKLQDTNLQWTLLVGPADALLDLAAAFGVLTWRIPNGSLGHNLQTAVVSGDGRILDLFPGLADWNASDLLAAVSGAGR